ncbi:hypothetical protein BCR36DRAFT_156698 [Piromyces finnis]|uniref:Uncharacterized protein n=1 Tax=Piromyces finnis TaxID=1754191 RepID=A0A1Y1UX50_9FUNG|nr:hypothetical protein BCR36DRAFT_156698 [Piromyces finnis]|eukprot:ORX42641.1 hypothetical protein BCR36DRAFT_156698 [Piromyces finnis]
MTTLSFYRKDSNINSNKIKFRDAIKNNVPFAPQYDNNHSNSYIVNYFKDVASQCHQLQTCKILFDNSNPTYSLIKDDSNDNLYFIVSLNNNIHAFQLKNNNGQYIMNSYDNESLNDLNDIIQGYGKSSKNIYNDAYIKGDDISIIPDCGIILTTRNILPTQQPPSYNPEDYIVSDENGNRIDNQLNEKLFDSNIYKSDDNLLCYYSNTDYIGIEEEASKFIEARSNEHSNLHNKISEFNSMNINIPEIIKEIENKELNMNNVNQDIINILDTFYKSFSKNQKQKQNEKDELKKLLTNEIYFLSNRDFKVSFETNYPTFDSLDDNLKYELMELSTSISSGYESHKERYERNHESDLNKIYNNAKEAHIKAKFEEQKKSIFENFFNENKDKLNKMKNTYINIEENLSKYENYKNSNSEKNIDDFVQENIFDFIDFLDKKSSKKNVISTFYNEFKNGYEDENYDELEKIGNTAKNSEMMRNYIINTNGNFDRFYEEQKSLLIESEYEKARSSKSVKEKMTSILNTKLSDINNRLKFLTARKNTKNAEKDEFTIIGHLATQNFIEKTYPVNINIGAEDKYKFVNIINDGPHFIEHSAASSLSKVAYSKSSYNAVFNQCKNKLAKRSGGESCKFCNQLKVETDIQISSTTLEILRTFKDMKLDPNILPVDTDKYDMKDINSLYKGANSMDELWSNIVKTYTENQDLFDKEQSEEFVSKFNNIVNDYVLVLRDSNYANKYSDIKITRNELENMISLYFSTVKAHENKYKESIEDNSLHSFDEFDSQSSLFKEKIDLNNGGELSNRLNYIRVK